VYCTYLYTVGLYTELAIQRHNSSYHSFSGGCRGEASIMVGWQAHSRIFGHVLAVV